MTGQITQRKDLALARELYDLFRVPDSDGLSADFPNVFVVGSVDRRITIHSQQHRALNLIWCLERLQLLPNKRPIAVIGGGIAGLTAAAYALALGHKVAIFEKHSELLALQEGSSRWVHPNIYNWPRDGWDTSETRLPVLNWSANRTAVVIARIRDQWTKSEERYGPLVFRKSKGVSFFRKGAAWCVTSPSSSKGKVELDVEAIILAVGFGEEKHTSYWEDDNLHQCLRDGGMALVSGRGDGGLIDVLRLALRDFQHDWLEDFAGNPELLGMKHQLIEIDNSVEALTDRKYISNAYLNLSLPSSAADDIRKRARRDISIILNARSASPFNSSSCTIHRVIVSELVRQGIVRFRPGHLSQQGNQVEIGDEAFTVDKLVIRHGPQPSLKEHFPQIWSRLDATRAVSRQRPLALELTRLRHWTLSASADPYELSLPVPHEVVEELQTILREFGIHILNARVSVTPKAIDTRPIIVGVFDLGGGTTVTLELRVTASDSGCFHVEGMFGQISPSRWVVLGRNWETIDRVAIEAFLSSEIVGNANMEVTNG